MSLGAVLLLLDRRPTHNKLAASELLLLAET
jgi:hypothetical protein